MSNTTVFDSKINELIRIIEKLKEESNSEKFMNALTGLFGLKTQDKEALGKYTESVEGLLDYARAIKTTLTNLSKKNTNTQIEYKLLKEEQDLAIETIFKQQNELKRIRKLLNEYKKTIHGLKEQNKKFQNTQTVLDASNNALQEQNEAQQNTIAGMDGILQKLTATLTMQRKTLEEQTKKINEITNSNKDLNTQLVNLKATQAETETRAKEAAVEYNKIIQIQDEYTNKIKAVQKIKVLFLKKSAKNKLKLQSRAFLDRIAEIKENSNNSIKDKDAEIKEITEKHTKAQNEINTQLNILDAAGYKTINEMRDELTSYKTEEKLSKEDQEKQKKMLNTVTRVFPLSWKNSKGFNIGNITTQVRGTKPYHANDTIDYYLHTLFKGETPIGEPRDIISSKQVPIRGILINEDDETSGGKKTFGGKKNRMKKSKKSNKSKNNKTKKQRGKR